MAHQKKILIVSNKEDVTTDLVVRRLRERAIGYFRFNTEVFPLGVSGSMLFRDKSFQMALQTPKGVIAQEDIIAVWYRRPRHPEFDGVTMSLDEKQFSTRESSAFLQNLWTTFDAVKWVNNPFALVKAEQKVFQLKTAVSVGLRIPNTLVSNRYGDYQAFVKKCHHGVVLKPISHGSVGSGGDRLIFANELADLTIQADRESIKVSPLIFQEKVAKLADVRLTAFGKEVFAHQVVSRDGSQPQILDWRRYKPTELEYRRVEPPKAVIRSVSKFQSLLNLEYGAFDFCIDKSDSWFFLEVNPSGQFAWLEIATGDKMIDALIDLLIGE